MRYTLLLYSDRSQAKPQTDEEAQQSREVFLKYIGALKEAGVFVDTDWLASTDTATTISLAGGERVVHDGPFGGDQRAARRLLRPRRQRPRRSTRLG